MGDKSNIEWTDSTWNPSTGCSKVSSGCKNCYAERVANRMKKMGTPKYAKGFEYAEHAKALDIPKRWKKPRRIFVNSMSDMFHERASLDFIIKCFEVMLEADQHTYQILTKRPMAMAAFTRTFDRLHGSDVPKHIWLGTSVEDHTVKGRIEYLQGALAKTRFVSFEPLIGPVGKLDLRGIDWAIIGGESGPHHRPMKAEWVRDIIRQCRRDGTAVFFKQWGGARPKDGGRMIDGKTYSEYPTV